MTYVIAGGGTGGHVFPAIAVADAMKSADPSARVLFVGTERGLEHSAVPKAGYELERIVISGIKGRSIWSKIRALFQLPAAIFQSMSILRRHKVEAVLGVGGYASGPAVIAAVLLGIPVGLCEPNSVPGFTNRILGRFAKRVFTAFKSTSAFFANHKIRLVGNAVRNKLLVAPRPVRLEGAPAHILVLGGSQGARALNENLPACFKKLKDEGRSFLVWHQTGAVDVKSTQETYAQLKMEARVDAFIEDMSQAYAWADLVICRSGATTCSEVLAAGPAAVFIPLPTAIYDHQMLNAKELADEGASVVLSQTEMVQGGLVQVVAKLLDDQTLINSMTQRARSLAKPRASADIAHSFLNRFLPGIILLCGTHFFTVA